MRFWYLPHMASVEAQVKSGEVDELRPKFGPLSLLDKSGLAFDFLCFCCHLLTFFQKLTYSKNSFRNTIRASNSLDVFQD